MNAPTNIQIINNDQGMPAFAVIPWEEYKVLTDQRDIDLKNGVPEAVVNMVFDKKMSPVKAWRKHLKLNQEQVSERLGITQSAYSQYESSDNLRPATLKKLADVFDLTVEQLDF